MVLCLFLYNLYHSLDEKLTIFFVFSPKIDFDSSCNLSPKMSKHIFLEKSVKYCSIPAAEFFPNLLIYWVICTASMHKPEQTV